MLTIALVGNPNAGKTTLFNALTGENQFVGNWPGVTVEKKEGRWTEDPSVEILDLPGVYSLTPYTPEEEVTRRCLMEHPPDAVLNVVDGTNLERNLYLTTQLLELNLPVVVVVNRIDVLDRRGQALDLDRLSARLGCPAAAVSAARGTGIGAGMAAAVQAAREGRCPTAPPLFSRQIEAALKEVSLLTERVLPAAGQRRAVVRLFEGDPQTEQTLGVGEALRQRIDRVASSCEADQGQDRQVLIAAGRYAFTAETARRCLSPGLSVQPERTVTQRLDKLLLNRLLALPLLAAALAGMFWFSIRVVGGWTARLGGGMLTGTWSLFGQSLPGLIPLLEYGLEKVHSAPWMTSLILEGIVPGVGTVLGFLPQLAALFLCLTFLESCGYLSRAAYLLDRAVRRFGLSGKSVAPFLLACGCGVPGVLACRTIRRESCRRLTILTATFLPCGAKLPVIAFLAGTVFSQSWWVAPLAYGAGVGAVLFSGWLLSGTRWFPRETGSFLMELPAYRWPRGRDLFRGVGQRLGEFLQKAGSLLLLASVAVWFAASFGWSPDGFCYLTGDNLECSLLARMGQGLVPLFAPLGWGDWRPAVAALTGLLAKESIVGTLAVLCPQGLPACLLMPAGAVSFLLFNLLCAPCLAALGAIRQEMASRRYFWIAVGYQTALAWLVAWGVYQVGTILMR